MKARPTEKPAYRVAEKPVKSARTIIDNRGLYEALDKVRAASSQRLSDRRAALFDNVPELPEHRKAEIKPFDTVEPVKRSKLAEAFNNEPRLGSVHPREDKDPPRCKPRPKNNRPTGDGSGRKRKFVPWC